LFGNKLRFDQFYPREGFLVEQKDKPARHTQRNIDATQQLAAAQGDSVRRGQASKRFRALFIAGGMTLITSLLLGRTHPFGNAALYTTKPVGAPIMQHSTVPPEVRATLVAKCADCHSMQSRAPLYGRFAPVSWLLERDILNGRKEVNFSMWDSYSADQQETIKAKIVEETKSREMPLPQYRMIHWNARITDGDVRGFIEWAHQMPALQAGAPAPATEPGDPVRGKETFEKRCTGCHSLEENREGPKLRGVYGRTSGTAAGYNYSPALIKAAVVWDESSLEKWLIDTDAFVPGNNMDFQVPKPQERRDLASYLKQQSGK
jgi:cytochrome c